jgi:hypothetical protein
MGESDHRKTKREDGRPCYVDERWRGKEDVSSLFSRSQRGDDVNGLREIAESAGWIFELHIDLDIGIHYG